MKPIHQSRNLTTMDSRVIPLSSSLLSSDHAVLDMACEFDRGFMVAWLFHDLVFGTITDGQLEVQTRSGPMDPKTLDRYLERARLFNRNKEAYLFRGEGHSLRGRIREDGSLLNPPSASEAIVKDVYALLLGKYQSALDKRWARFVSTRGSALVVPAQWADSRSKRAVVHMRYYIGRVNHLASIVDQRIVQVGPPAISLDATDGTPQNRRDRKKEGSAAT